MSAGDRSKIVFLVSCACLLFAAGVGVGRFEIFPFSVMQLGFNALSVSRTQVPIMFGIQPAEHLRPARGEGEGVTVSLPDRMEPGLTLVSAFMEGDNGLALLAPDGELVHRWPVRFSEIFPDPEHLVSSELVPATDWNTEIHGAWALPNGSVVFNFEYGGLARIDRCGAVEWTLPRITHHSLEPAEGGGFWVPGRVHRDDVLDFPSLDAGFEVDVVLKVSDEGEILDEIPVTRILADNGLIYYLTGEMREEFERRWAGPAEIVHLNDVEELPSALADRYPQFEAGDLLLSFHNLNLIVVLDPDDRSIKWHQTGPWVQQHDPDFTESGEILVFDNNPRDLALGKEFTGSRIVSIDPQTRRTTLRFGSASGLDFYSAIRGKQQLLPNGNLLITEAEGGRAIEVDDEGELVWEFVNRYNDHLVATVTQATRFAPDYFEVDSWACPG